MKYLVKVSLAHHKELTVYARTEEEAEEKALEIVTKWNNVEDAEILEVQEAGP